MSYEISSLVGNEWNDLIASFPEPHILQSWEWGQVKALYGWQPRSYIWRDERNLIVAAAMILKRTISMKRISTGLSVLYVPKGPSLIDWDNKELRTRVFDDLGKIAMVEKGMFVKMDPDIQLGFGIPGEFDARDIQLGLSIIEELSKSSWQSSYDQVQYKNTVIIDISLPEDELLSKMKQKTRYNIRLADRKGVFVRIGSEADLKLLYQMYAETSVRDGFVIRSEGYYHDMWSTFLKAGMADALIAEVNGDVIAGLILFHFAKRAWYLYGMSRPIHREKMPNYLLQWEAIKRAKHHGCAYYDMWGAPDQFSENDPMWNVFRFKSGFGGVVVRHIGAWDLVTQPLAYRIYARVMPWVLDTMRRRGRAATGNQLID